MAIFKNLYSKLLVLKKAKRESKTQPNAASAKLSYQYFCLQVIFVTRDLVTHLGLPTASAKERYASPLVHADLLHCISAGDKAATKALRDRIKRVIKNEESTSEVVTLKIPGGWGRLPVRLPIHLMAINILRS